MMQAKNHGHPADERDGFRFRGGHSAIDLPATLQARLKPAPRELLKAPEDLARWLVAAGLTPTLPETTEADLALAHALREAIYALANARLSEGADPSAARAIVNAIAANPPAIPHLSPEGTIGMMGPASALLATLAREAIYLFGSEMAGSIRQCQSPACTLFFVDTSRSGDRRWCSMSGCGNKAKVAEFRSRKRKARTGA